MAEINLLKQNQGPSDIFALSTKTVVYVLGAVFLGLLAWYGYLFLDAAHTDSQIGGVQKSIESTNSDALAIPGRSELLVRQQQLQNLTALVASHPYWSQLFQPLADATLKTAVNNSLEITKQGTLTMTVSVPTVDDFDKYMQVFDQKQFYDNFSNIRISGFSEVPEKNGTTVRFQVTMDYDPSLIQYNPANNNQ